MWVPHICTHMMGTHHAVSGAAAWVAVTSTVPGALGWHPLPTASVVAGALLTAGASLVLDIDHHGSTAAHSGGIVTRAIASGVEAVAGHRGALHSIVAVGALTLGAVLAGHWQANLPVVGVVPLGSVLVFTLLLALASKVFRLNGPRLAGLWGGSLIAAAVVMFLAPEQLEWLPLSVMVGAIVHLVGDGLTTEGVPLLWPLRPKPPKGLREAPVVSAIWKRNGNFAIPVLGHTGSLIEWGLFVALSAYTLYVLASTTGLFGGGA